MSTKKEDSVFKMVVVLTLACLISGIALAYTYSITKERIIAAEASARLSSVRTVLPPFDGEPKELTLSVDGVSQTFFVGEKEGALVGVAIATKAIGYGGDVNILVGINPEGAITGMALLQHQETPGLGTKAGEPKFMSQFFGKKLTDVSDSIEVTKDGGSIDAVTAATITSRAVAKAATEALKLFLKSKEQLV
jgi:electron transport complex protein RnfG